MLARVSPDAAQMLRRDAVRTDDLRYPLMGRANGDQGEDTLPAADDALMHLNLRFHYLPPCAGKVLSAFDEADEAGAQFGHIGGGSGQAHPVWAVVFAPQPS